jgi:hypothetical protein
MQTRRIDNGLIFQQGQAIDRSRQAGVSKPEVGQRYRFGRQARGQGQAEWSDGLRVRTESGLIPQGTLKRI